MSDTHSFEANSRAYDLVFKGPVETACLKAAFELGLFTLLANGPLDLEAIAVRTESVPHRLERFLISLRQMGLLDEADGRWGLSPLAAQFFVTPAPDPNLTMVPFVESLVRQMETFYMQLADVVRGRINYTSLAPFPPRSREDNLFYETIHRSNVYFPVKLLRERAKLEGVRRLIDVGGGVGDIAAALCEQYEQLHVTLINRPGALELVEENVAARGLSGRIEAVGLDMYREPYPRGDAVLFSRILYPMNADMSRALCQKAYDALEPGGRILILDMVIDDPQRPNYDYLAHYVCGIGLDFSVLEFKSHTIYAEMLPAIGFHDVTFDSGYEYVLCQAVK